MIGLFSLCFRFLWGSKREVGNSDAEQRKGGLLPRGISSLPKLLHLMGSLCSHTHIQNDRGSSELILQQNCSVWSTHTVSLSQLLKKWEVVQFAGVPFKHKEDRKLTARLQIYGRVICPDAAVLVTVFSFRNRKQGSHLMTTHVVFS